MKKKVLVTGGAGYIGSFVVDLLLKQNYSVCVLDNLTFGDDGIKEFYDNANFEFIKGDIKNIKDVVRAMEGVSIVIHLAAIVGDPASQIDEAETLTVNYYATKFLVELSIERKIEHFIFASTCSVYGASDGQIIDETSVLNPVSTYATTKIKSEELITSYKDQLPTTILRLSTIYGLSKRMRFDLVVNILTAKAFFENKFDIYDGEQWRPLLHAKDAARAFVICATSPVKLSGEAFNVGSDEASLQISDIGKLVKREFPDAEVSFFENKVDRRSYNVTFKKIQSEFGFKLTKNIFDGIDEIKKFLKSNDIDYTDKKYYNVNYKELKPWYSHVVRK